MKCQKCGANDARIISNSFDTLEFECCVCGRTYALSKISVGKKFVSAYVGAISHRLLRESCIVVEARGFDIYNMLIIAGFFVAKDKVAVIDDIDISYTVDAVGKIVSTERIVLRKI